MSLEVKKKDWKAWERLFVRMGVVVSGRVRKPLQDEETFQGGKAAGGLRIVLLCGS